jgi:CRISPR-associated endonuclease Cas1
MAKPDDTVKERRPSPPDVGGRAQAVAETYSHTGLYNGVCVVDGWGARARVERGHLEVSDGLGPHRRTRRYARIGNDLARIVILATTGTVTLEALRWCQNVGARVVVMDGEGQPAFMGVTPGVNDARLRRAQALAATTEVGQALTVELLAAKLAGHANILDERLQAPTAAARVRALASALEGTVDAAEARQIEARAAAIYWEAWSDETATAVRFPLKDLRRIPDHWTRYDGRRSPLQPSGNRLATNPTNALLNYLYRLAEIEAVQALQAVGLDPGLGVLHADTPGRDSLALDLIEPVRPVVERTVLDLISGRVFRKTDFAETSSGIVRLLAPLSHQLTITMGAWAAEIAPWAEHLAAGFSVSTTRRIRTGTRLTGRNRRSAQMSPSQRRTTRQEPSRGESASRRTPAASTVAIPVQRRCEGCGTALHHRQRRWCPDCWEPRRAVAATTATTAARAQLQDPTVRASRGAAVATGKAAANMDRLRSLGFRPEDWLTIAHGLRNAPVGHIAAATGLSTVSAYRIRSGQRTPAPQHWRALAVLAGLTLPAPRPTAEPRNQQEQHRGRRASSREPEKAGVCNAAIDDP